MQTNSHLLNLVTQMLHNMDRGPVEEFHRLRLLAIDEVVKVHKGMVHPDWAAQEVAKVMRFFTLWP